MADAPKIVGTDTLRSAYPKLNSAIDNANEALTTAGTAKSTADLAKSTADTALSNSENTQAQLDTIVINGDSSVEAAQARVKSDGTTFTTLQQRLNDSDAQLAETEQDLIKKEEKIAYGAKQVEGLLFDDTGSLAETTTEITSDTRHLAFPAIIKFLNQHIVFYRAGADHATYDGKIVYKTSSDGVTWSAETVLLETANYDYRDPSVIIFNNKLVMKYFYRLSDGTAKTCVISTDDLITWSAPVVLPSPNSANNASRGNMAISGNTLYSINYFNWNDTFIVSTTDLENWTVTVPLLKADTNEASITFVQNKFICLLRQAIYDSNGKDYDSPLLWGESVDGVTWDFKELPLYGHCPSLHVLKVNAFGTDRLIVSYRDMSQNSTLKRGYFNLAMLNTRGELFSSRIYNLFWATDKWDLGYGDVLIDGAKVFLVYYSYLPGGKIHLKTFVTDELSNFSTFKHKHPELIERKNAVYLNPSGVKSTKEIKQYVNGDIDVTGDGTGQKSFAIDLTPLAITGALVNLGAFAVHSSGGFSVRFTSVSNTQLSGILKVDSGTFSTTIKVYWSALNIK